MLGRLNRMDIVSLRTCAGLIVCTSLMGCFSEPGREPDRRIVIVEVVLTAHGSTDHRSGLRLLRVDKDGTAHIKSAVNGQIYTGRPDSRVAGWVLEQTNVVAQTATLHDFMD
jgi:hypothetical protein